MVTQHGVAVLIGSGGHENMCRNVKRFLDAVTRLEPIEQDRHNAAFLHAPGLVGRTRRGRNRIDMGFQKIQRVASGIPQSKYQKVHVFFLNVILT